MNTSVSYHYSKLGSKDLILFMTLNKAGCIRRFHGVFLIVYLGSSLLLTVTNEPSLGLFSYLLTHAKKTDIVLIAICYEFKKNNGEIYDESVSWTIGKYIRTFFLNECKNKHHSYYNY